jgi:hypothetical protein
MSFSMSFTRGSFGTGYSDGSSKHDNEPPNSVKGGILPTRLPKVCPTGCNLLPLITQVYLSILSCTTEETRVNGNETKLNHSGLVISTDEGFDYQSHSKTINSNQNRVQEILRPYLLSTSQVRSENVNGNIRKRKNGIRKTNNSHNVWWMSQQLLN